MSFLKTCAALLAGVLLSTSAAKAQKPASMKPLLREFIGLNVHTVSFKPELYQPVTRMVRDYHPLEWDLGDDTTYAPPFPFARNKVDWESLYGTWKKDGYDVHVSVMIDTIKPDAWKHAANDAYAYGFLFARFFGPSGARKLVNSMEIGNEPGKYSDELYRTVFLNAAQGIRKADPQMKIVTCNTELGKSGDYHKSLDLFKDLSAYYDVINIHDYSQAEPYPTWRRSYPEDPTIPYLKQIQDTIKWRDKNAAGKPVWITEFGYDSTTQPQMKEGDFKQWVGVTDTQQAQYLVRSFLVFSGMDVERAYIYFFNDDDKPMLHGSAGLTRNYAPKPSFYAMAQLQKVMGDYRFSRVVTEKSGDVYVYEFKHASDPKKLIWAVWSPTGNGKKAVRTLKNLPGKIVHADRMTLKPGDIEVVNVPNGSSEIQVDVEESPLYLQIVSQ